MHPMSGLLGNWTKYVQKLGDERSVYGFEHPHYSDRLPGSGSDLNPLHISIGELVRLYIDALEHRIGKTGHFVLGTYSGGAIYFAEVLVQLLARSSPGTEDRMPRLAFCVDGMAFPQQPLMPIVACNAVCWLCCRCCP